jgi:hypothetical protein
VKGLVVLRVEGFFKAFLCMADNEISINGYTTWLLLEDSMGKDLKRTYR